MEILVSDSQNKLKLIKAVNEYQSHEGGAFDNDVFGDRKVTAERLTKLIETVQFNYVLNVNSEWGTGKTYFLREWQKLLKSEDKPCVYFNAWTHDHNEDAFPSLFAEVGNELKEDSELYKKIVKAGGQLIVSGIRGLAKHYLGDDTIDAIAKTAESMGQEAIQNAFDKKDNLKQFKGLLSEMAAKAVGGKVFVFIDELDRCKPTFAVEVLEKVKHFFDVEGVIFVIASDNTQLQATVKAAYGESFNSENYLNRFFDQNVRLPQPNYESFARLLNSQNPIVGEGPSSFDSLSNDMVLSFSSVAACFKLSLRDQQQCYAKVHLVMSCMEQRVPFSSFFLCFMVVLRHKDREFYEWLGTSMDKWKSIDANSLSKLRGVEVKKETELSLLRRTIGGRHPINRLIRVAFQDPDFYAIAKDYTGNDVQFMSSICNSLPRRHKVSTYWKAIEISTNLTEGF